MIIYPAIDLRGGYVVRLREGDPQQQVTFHADPLDAARRWLGEGADWLHVVNLDGAFAESNDNLTLLEGIAATGAKVQFGGGLRSLEQMKRAIHCGASRLVLGTVAVMEPELVGEAIQRFGAETVCVALDARDGKIATHGWKQVSDSSPAELGVAMAQQGLRHALFTDISRDGRLSGVNVSATVRLARDTGLQVIASGGVSRLEEIEALQASGLVAGAVIGMALYRNEISLADALTAASRASDA
ncbi:MAG: 1-(5-phosphoribosyl)-5-[(5-phosphoribosylamino)methylideneamino]imidazole-4-carboxamide isomerase [Anaerolineaceae bacterium]|nr:1-(5-phosphoribosyl)-5-[(5-phosphoribosylamino)methylideneamino]imidazole-4-carboxamide isomerase [Anaerolineaceae bacterium]